MTPAKTNWTTRHPENESFEEWEGKKNKLALYEDITIIYIENPKTIIFNMGRLWLLDKQYS